MRLPFALAVLALPLAGAIWAVGGFAAQKERERADARLEASLRSAGVAYVTEGNDVQRRARELALSRPVQRALAERDRRALARLAARHPDASFGLGRARAEPTRPALARTVDVISAQRVVVGSVTAFAPLDARLARQIEMRPGVAGDVRVAFADLRGRILAPESLEGRVPASTTNPVRARLRGTTYRVVSAPLRGVDARLAALVPHASIASAERRARGLVLLAGLVTLIGVVVAAYLVAPVIARARVEQRQRAEAARVLEQVGDGICAVDGEGVIRIWNRAAEAITGLGADDVRGRPAATAVPGWTKLEELVPASSSPGEARSPVTVPLDVGDRELWLSVSAVRSDDGTVYAFRDLTEERRFEEMRSDLVTTVSHELRTPVASIHGAAVTLRRRELDAETRDDLLAVVAEQSNRLARLADEILLTSRLGLGSAEVRTDRVDPVEIARDVVEAARAQTGGRRFVALQVRGQVPAVLADAAKLRQVLVNLVDNAIKYSAEGGRIEVGLGRVDHRVRITVRDQGIGIPAGEQDRIFEKFYRLDPQLSRGVGGGGLGLYISRELIRHMGGRISVESQPGRGSTFTVELAVAGSVVSAAPAA